MTFPIYLTSPNCPRDRVRIDHGYHGEDDWYFAHWEVRHGNHAGIIDGDWESATNGVPLAHGGDYGPVVAQAFAFMIDNDCDDNGIAHDYAI